MLSQGIHQAVNRCHQASTRPSLCSFPTCPVSAVCDAPRGAPSFYLHCGLPGTGCLLPHLHHGLSLPVAILILQHTVFTKQQTTPLKDISHVVVTGLFQLAEYCSPKQKLASWISGQGTCLGFELGSVTGRDVYERQSINVSQPLFTPSLPLSLKLNNFKNFRSHKPHHFISLLRTLPGFPLHLD